MAPSPWQTELFLAIKSTWAAPQLCYMKSPPCCSAWSYLCSVTVLNSLLIDPVSLCQWPVGSKHPEASMSPVTISVTVTGAVWPHMDPFRPVTRLWMPHLTTTSTPTRRCGADGGASGRLCSSYTQTLRWGNCGCHSHGPFIHPRKEGFKVLHTSYFL